MWWSTPWFSTMNRPEVKRVGTGRRFSSLCRSRRERVELKHHGKCRYHKLRAVLVLLHGELPFLITPKGWQNVQTGTSQFKQLQTNRKDVWNEDKFACFTAKLLGKWHEHDLFRVFAGSPNSVLCLRDRHIISVNQWKNGRRPKTHLIQLFHWNFQVLSTNQTTFVL